MSRRVLEVLTYLARNHASVASLLLYLNPPSSGMLESHQHSNDSKKDKGKGKLLDGAYAGEAKEQSLKGEIPLMLFLKLLNQPLYSRSSAHLEQVRAVMTQ